MSLRPCLFSHEAMLAALDLTTLLFRGDVTKLKESVLILINPEICAGKTVVRGTKVPVQYLIRMARKGYSPKSIAEEFDLPRNLVKEVLQTVERTSIIKFA